MMTRDHNEKTPQEIYEDQKFLASFAELRDLESAMAGTKGDIGSLYKRMKDMGWTKKDFEFAKSLENKDVGQVVADFERKIRIAKLFGHRLARQMELRPTDATPEADVAYDRGFAAGRRRSNASNPYTFGSTEHQRYTEGENDGRSLANKSLNEAVNGTAPAEEAAKAPEAKEGAEVVDMEAEKTARKGKGKGKSAADAAEGSA